MQQTSIVHSGSVQFKTERIVDMRLIGPAFAFVALFGVGGDGAYAKSRSTLSCFNNSAVMGWTIIDDQDAGFQVKADNYGSTIVAGHFGLPGMLVDMVAPKGIGCEPIAEGLSCSSEMAQVRSHTFDPDQSDWIPSPFYSTYNLSLKALRNRGLWSITLSATNVSTHQVFTDTYADFRCRSNDDSQVF